jgi:hypothetical protein
MVPEMLKTAALNDKGNDIPPPHYVHTVCVFHDFQDILRLFP